VRIFVLDDEAGSNILITIDAVDEPLFDRLLAATLPASRRSISVRHRRTGARVSALRTAQHRPLPSIFERDPVPRHR
jgi:hypothetical protein